MNLISPVGQVVQSRSLQVINAATYATTIALPSGLAPCTCVVRITDQQQHVYITKFVVR